MVLIADILLIAAAIGAAVYCLVLSRRLRRFTDLEHGVGGAVAVLSVQVDDLEKALEQARATATDASDRLEATTKRAEDIAQRLESAMTLAGKNAADPAEASVEPPRTIRRKRRGPPSSETQGDAA